MSEEVEMKPIAPEEVGAVPPKVAPSAVAAAPAASTVKLKPIIRKPVIRKPVIGGAKPVALKPASGVPPAPAAVPEAAAEAAKAAAPAPEAKPIQDAMPAQAILHKTGIIAEGILTPAQAQAAKTKTSRISLESAIGVAPSIKSGAPMKTIKLRRITDLPPAPGAVKVEAPKPAAPAEAAPAPASPAAEAPAPAAEAPAPTPAEEAKSAEPPVTMTQKKTLKLQRPGFKRPTVGGLRRPGAAAATAPAAPAPASADSGVADLPGDVADLPADGGVADIRPLPPVADLPGSASSATVAGVPSWLNVSTIVAGAAAIVVMGLCAWTLFREAVGPAAGPNDLATFHSDTDYRR